MTMAAALGRRTAEAPARPKASRIARVDIIGDLDQAEKAWRALDDGRQFATPYQRFDFSRPGNGRSAAAMAPHRSSWSPAMPKASRSCCCRWR
jgi:CelD/BcsL family acetyltransferase involved in cellulose biosynthesis